MPKNPSPDRSSIQVLQTLAWIRKQGFRPVATHPRSKAAVSREYADVSYVPPTDDLWRQQDYGVGIVTGPRHSGPVDIDLDCAEAVFFAKHFLPPTTAVFGRASKQRSHYLYKVETTTFDKQAFIDPVSHETIVEMRGDAGHQTIAPGSIHEETGELIEWSDVPFPEVTVVASDQLTRAVRKIAIATLIVRFIWADGYHNEPTKHLSGLFFYLEWTAEEAEQIIAAVMEYSNDRDKSRIPTIRATYRRAEQGKKVSGAGVLRRQLNNDRVIDKLLEWAGSPTINLLQEYNARFAVVSIEGKFRIADTDVAVGEAPTFYQKDDFLNLMGTDFASERNDDGKPIPKARVWLANPRRRQYKSVDFLPGVDDSDLLNLWTGWAVSPDAKAGTCKAWLKLLKEIICGGDAKLYDWMLHWFANIVREPMKKSLTAPVIIGPEGAGKSLLLGYFGRILGNGYTTVTNEDHVYGRFNKHIASTLLLHSEEALYGGEKKHAGIIRSLITDEFRIYEQKGVDARRVRNFLRLVLTSNELHAAPAKPGDRRYTVISMGDRKISERLIKDVLEELEGGGPAALHAHLLAMDYDPKIPRINVKNEALAEMKGSNYTPLEAWWHDTLNEGCVLPDHAAWAEQPPKDEWPEVVGSAALYGSMLEWVKARNMRAVPNNVLMAQQLDRFVARRLVRAPRRFTNPMADDWPSWVKLMSDRQSAIINMPSLELCRAAFEKYIGQKISWPLADEAPKVKEQHDKY